MWDLKYIFRDQYWNIYIYILYMVNVCGVNSKQPNRFSIGSKSWLLFETFIGTEAIDSQTNKPAHWIYCISLYMYCIYFVTSCILYYLLLFTCFIYKCSIKYINSLSHHFFLLFQGFFRKAFLETIPHLIVYLQSPIHTTVGVVLWHVKQVCSKLN